MNFIEQLKKNPVKIFQLALKSGTIDEINNITKSLLDPIAKDYSVLDEIYTEGLDSSQVWGQTQMVLSNIGESLLFSEIPKLREAHGVVGKNAIINGSEEESEESRDDIGDNSDYEDEASNSYESSSKGNYTDTMGENAELELKADVDDDSSHHKIILGAEHDAPENVSDQVSSGLVEDAFGLNDGFFDIDSFNKQILDLEDENLDDNDQEEVDLFADLSDGGGDDAEQDMEYYDEFFDKPGHKSSVKEDVTNAASEDVQENHDSARDLEDTEYDQALDSAMIDFFEDDRRKEGVKHAEGLSSFEKQQEKLRAEITELEAELVAEKKWAMKGEVKSRDRPMDSLLNDDEMPNLEFDRTSKPVPVITDEVTETIEGLIKRRITNDEFDDLPRRLISDVGKYVQKNKAIVSDQKSSKSLAEIYEDEYHGVEPDEKISEEVCAAHDEIINLFTQISYKLDSLCSAHYIPKPNEFKSIEIKVSDAPASVSMEDVQPLHVSDELKLAPQEIYKIGDYKPKADGTKGTSQVQLKSGLSYSKDELDHEDKQRLRRAKKRAKSKHFNELKEIRTQRIQVNSESDKEGDRKRQRKGDVVDTLSKAKNLTVIDKSGQLRDAQGKLKNSAVSQSSNTYRL